MKYYELTLDTPSQEIDLRCDKLTELGAEGFMIEDEADLQDFLEHNRQYWDYIDQELEERFRGLSRIKFYLCDDEDGLAALERIKAAYPQIQLGIVQDSDWENNWRDYYKPIDVGQRLVVVPQWEEIPQNGRLPLILDPGLTFGTGSHATTHMCLEALEDHAKPGVRVLDLGCGSGILGIGALVLGCKHCVGVDIDPKSPEVALSNAELNGIGPDRIRTIAGDVIGDESLRLSLGSGYALVLANIVADVIIPLSSCVRRFMSPDGVFICSGIIDHRREETQEALLKNGFEVIRHLHREEWHCFVCR